MAVNKSNAFRFIHVADPHVGHSGNASKHNEYRSLRVDKKINDINARQHDINEAFRQVIQIAIDKKVDAVLNAGDGWDAWGYRQPNVANFYNMEVLKLKEKGIFYLEVVGNHDLAKQAGKGNHLELLGKILEDKGFTAYQGVYEKCELPEHNVVIHCAPSSFNQEILDESIESIKENREEGKINIGIGHFGVTAIKHYAENAINSLVVDLDRLIACHMHYFALGDYHTPTDFGHNIRYAGSTERLGLDEIGNRPQVLLVEIDKDTFEVEVTPIYLNVRDMIDLPVVDAENKEIEIINSEIVKRIQDHELTDKIVRLRVKNLPTHLKRSIHQHEIRKMTEEALYFRLDLVDKSNKTKESRTAGHEVLGVIEGFKPFVMTVEEDGTFTRDELLQEGIDGLEEALEGETAKG